MAVYANTSHWKNLSRFIIQWMTLSLSLQSGGQSNWSYIDQGFVIFFFLASSRQKSSSFHLSVSTKVLRFHLGPFWHTPAGRKILSVMLIILGVLAFYCCCLAGTIPASRQLHRGGNRDKTVHFITNFMENILLFMIRGINSSLAYSHLAAV